MSDEIEQLAERIATALNEPKRETIEAVARELGKEATAKVFFKTAQTLKAGGMMTANGKRKRTPGGLFFFFAKQKLGPEGRQRTGLLFQRERQAAGDVVQHRDRASGENGQS